MTPATISSGLVPTPPPSTPVDQPVPKVIAPIAGIITPEPAASTGSPSSTTVDQDAHHLVKRDEMENSKKQGLSNGLSWLPVKKRELILRSFAPVARLTLFQYSSYLCAHMNILSTRKKVGDVKTAILERILREEVYVSQPDRFVDQDNPNHVFKLKKTLYGLKQAPRAWWRNQTDEAPKGMSVDPTHYRGMVGTLMYLTASRPDLTFVVCMLCSYQAKPSKSTYMLEQRIFKYLKRKLLIGTLVSKGFFYTPNSQRLVSWSSKRQKSAAISSTEAKYIALSGCCAQVLWMRSQLTDYGLGFNKIPMYSDNKSVLPLCCNNIINYDIYTIPLERRNRILINKLEMLSYTPQDPEQLQLKPEE
ncbi:retrovirus-related pol polyprotein from transposon TNT 1-94 [Tanacetum coccineum]